MQSQIVLKILSMSKVFIVGLWFFFFSSVVIIASETNKNQIETKRSGFWTYYCKNNVKQRQCEIARKINIEQQNETFLIIYKIAKNIKSQVNETLNIMTPPSSRVNVKKRLKVSFDDKTKFTRCFLECDETGCLVVFKSNKIFKYSMKNFGKMKITFYGFEDKEPLSLTLPMDGFNQALDDITQQLKSF